jgi:LytT family two-component system sensor histidine kinase NatK
MKASILYWVLLAAFGTIHVEFLLKNLSWDVPTYLVSLPVMGIVYYLYKRILLPINSIGIRWNLILLAMQFFLVTLYFTVELSRAAFVLILTFAGLEAIRLIGSRKIFDLTRNLQQYEAQREHINETFRVVRGERHEFLKHVSAVHYMLENGKAKEAKHYLDDLVDGYEETNLSIKGERGVVAGVLHQMYRRAQRSGISVVYDLDLPLSTLPVSDPNMVTLIGNLLSNSIDACEEWQKHYKQQAILTVQFYKRSGLYLLVCRNNSLPIPTPILDRLYQSYGHTTKGEGHEGLGTKMVKDVVCEHQGFLDFVYRDEEFTVKIKIPEIR